MLTLSSSLLSLVTAMNLGLFLSYTLLPRNTSLRVR